MITLSMAVLILSYAVLGNPDINIFNLAVYVQSTIICSSNSVIENICVNFLD